MELRLISLCFYDLQVRDLSIHKITRRFAPEKINKIELYFCIQRMFEIICEIKFKYVWRCFIKSRIDFCEILLSLPSRKCGLKSMCMRNSISGNMSLPSRKCGLKFVGGLYQIVTRLVTSLAEVWIEINIQNTGNTGIKSLPSRKCGLKFHLNLYRLKCVLVTSLAEVWIEIHSELRY